MTYTGKVPGIAESGDTDRYTITEEHGDATSSFCGFKDRDCRLAVFICLYRLQWIAMQCPQCREHFHDELIRAYLFDKKNNYLQDSKGLWAVRSQICPNCKNVIVLLEWGKLAQDAREPEGEIVVYPEEMSRFPPPAEVPSPLREDYLEACLTLTLSPKASAALSRRSLQTLLRGYAKVRPSNLEDEIQQVLDSGGLPSHIAEALDGVRNIGNFAAHPIKSLQTGQIADVEPGEAEWLLDTLEDMFDFYFVKPARLKKRREKLDAKLKEHGKPPLRT